MPDTQPLADPRLTKLIQEAINDVADGRYFITGAVGKGSFAEYVAQQVQAWVTENSKYFARVAEALDTDRS